jgi:hypothetical protein
MLFSPFFRGGRSVLPIRGPSRTVILCIGLLLLFGLAASSLFAMRERAQANAAREELQRSRYYQHLALAERESFANAHELGAADDKDTPKKAAPVVPPRQGKSETIHLFNGKDLDGWEGHANLWSVQDGVIIAKNTEPIKVSTYLLTKRHFSDFRLTATVRLVQSEMHSGIAFWGRKAPEHGDPYTYAGHLVMFPSDWGMYDLFGRNGLPVDGQPAKKVGKQHGWNDLEILAQGNRVRVVVNGTLVVDWRDPEPERIKEGPIGLQLHSNKVPQEVHFRNLVLTTFPEDKLTTVK